MGLDDITKLCKNIARLETEGPVQRLQEGLKSAGLERLSLSLVGKVITNKLVNSSIFRDVFRKIWWTKGRVEIEAASNNVFTFQFEKAEDRCRILAGGPWTFDGALIVLEKPIGKGDVQDMSFSWAEFWVQIYQVPLLCMTKEIGQFLGSMVGVVKDVDVGLTGECSGDFLRVRVVVDISKPLRRCIRVDVMGDEEETVMLLRSERLPNHCFRCGRLGHPARECMDAPLVDGETGAEVLPFGAWLRTSALEKQWRRRSNFQPNSGSAREWRSTTPVGVRGCKAPPISVSIADQHLIGVNANNGNGSSYEEKRNENIEGRDCGDVSIAYNKRVNGFVFNSKGIDLEKGSGAVDKGHGPGLGDLMNRRPTLKGKEKAELWATDVGNVGLAAQQNETKDDPILTKTLGVVLGRVDCISVTSDTGVRDLVKNNLGKKGKTSFRWKRCAREVVDGHVILKNGNENAVVFGKRGADGDSRCYETDDEVVASTKKNQLWLEDYPPCIARSLFTDCHVGVSGLRG
ncbi:hypothetical protein EZV62_015373 [Acer yangbiense]|uniref:CCHC-type domain-containing protein n=1 Tax=Acer yangbiense TaxID=1000413 RepID=A0A5C7HKY9_9ROSI|nr:hypothetical protein EZV62_015373 [Acer yangbiense]